MKLFRISSFLSIFAKVQSAAVPLMAAGQSDETAMTLSERNEQTPDSAKPWAENNDVVKTKPDWMTTFDEYMKSDELEFDFDIFFSTMSDAEFDDFTFYTIELVLEHLNEMTTEITDDLFK